MARKFWIAAVAIGLILFATVCLKPHAGAVRPFNEKIWRAQDNPEADEWRRVKSISDLWKIQDDGNARLRMFKDLKPKLIGLTREEVLQLLGPSRKDFEADEPNCIVYLLGTRKDFFDTDGIMLRLTIKNGIVSDARVN